MPQPLPSVAAECDVIHQCNVCNKAFDTEPQLGQHLWDVHIGDMSEKNRRCGDISAERILVRDMSAADDVSYHSQQPRSLLPTQTRKLYKCAICAYSCQPREHMVKHLRCHTGEKPHKCKVCDYASTQLSALYLHLRTKHPRFKPFQCTVCVKAFLTPSRLKRHLSTHARQQKQHTLVQGRQQKVASPRNDSPSSAVGLSHKRIRDRQFKCDVCRKQFNEEVTLERHLLETHIGTYIRTEANQRYKCSLCKYSSNRKHLLDRHVRCHTGEKPQKCKVCDFASAYRSALYRHVKHKHPSFNPFKCTVCGDAFLTSTQWKRHLCSQTRKQTQYTFVQGRQQKVASPRNDSPSSAVGLGHERDNDRNFKCDVCSKQFSAEVTLARHLTDAHIGNNIKTKANKLYKCTLCKYASNLKWCRDAHVRCHTGEKPHKCKVCDYASTHPYALYVHLKNKHPSFKPFKCTVCGEAFLTSTRLKRHLCSPTRQQTQCTPARGRQQIVRVPRRDSPSCLVGLRHRRILDRKFKCDVCSKQFNAEKTLASHLMGDHIRIPAAEKCNQDLTESQNVNRTRKRLQDLEGMGGEGKEDRSSCTYGTSLLSRFARSTKYRSECRCDPMPFKCTVCCQPFATQTQLRQHFRRHTGYNSKMGGSSQFICKKKDKAHRPYKCTLCKYASKHKHNLDKHVRFHTGEKPYKCRVCEQAFADISNVYKHMASRHPGMRPFKCTMCDDDFIRPLHLERHLQMHMQ